jgi:hypothetical protein
MSYTFFPVMHEVFTIMSALSTSNNNSPRHFPKMQRMCINQTSLSAAEEGGIFTAEILRILLRQDSGWVPRKGCSHGSRWKQPAPQLGWASLDTDAMENNLLWTVDSTTLPQSQSAVYTSKFRSRINKILQIPQIEKGTHLQTILPKKNLPLSSNYSVLLWVLIKEAVWRIFHIILSSDSYRTLLQWIMQYTPKLLDSS